MVAATETPLQNTRAYSLAGAMHSILRHQLNKLISKAPSVHRVICRMNKRKVSEFENSAANTIHSISVLDRGGTMGKRKYEQFCTSIASQYDFAKHRPTAISVGESRHVSLAFLRALISVRRTTLLTLEKFCLSSTFLGPSLCMVDSANLNTCSFHCWSFAGKCCIKEMLAMVWRSRGRILLHHWWRWGSLRKVPGSDCLLCELGQWRGSSCKCRE